jgi:hypothetical protein
MDDHNLTREILNAHYLAVARVRQTGDAETVTYGRNLVEIFLDDSGSPQARVVQEEFQSGGHRFR